MKEATRLVDICLDAGVNSSTRPMSIRMASSEEILGQAIKGRRDKVLISTKATFRLGEGPNDVGSSRYHLIAACEASLKRLGTDYIDLYFMHGFDALTPVEETAHALDDLVRDGQGALHRLLEFFRLASDEVARRRRQARLAALCRRIRDITR